MMNSMSICTGFHAMNLKQHDGWTLDYDHRRACALPGLVVLHKYTHPAELTDAFANLTRINSAAIATTCRTFIIELQRRWRTDTLKPIFTEWARLFNNYEMLLTGYFVPVITMPKIQPTKKPITGKTNALGFPLQEREAVITVVVWFLSFFISFSIVSCHFWKCFTLYFTGGADPGLYLAQLLKTNPIQMPASMWTHQKIKLESIERSLFLM